MCGITACDFLWDSGHRLKAERNLLFFSMLVRHVASRSLLAPKLLVLSLPVFGGTRGVGF